jgi:Pyruvate/2-oxoacid:ferredoxin oxidoreductase delta subunit
LRQYKNRDSSGNGYGNGGSCVCSTCNVEVPHQRGVKCYDIMCPECGKPLTRKVPGEENNTSNSNTIQSNIRVALISKDDCIGCGKCVSVCPFDAIVMESNKAVVISDLCRGCMKCARVCPTQAIKRS